MLTIAPPTRLAKCEIPVIKLSDVFLLFFLGGDSIVQLYYLQDSVSARYNQWIN